jgi:predicted MFS family arabinose efflux permease
VSGLHLLAMGVYDLSNILGLVSTTSTSAERHLWSLPALTPPEETLLAFGCYDRSVLYSQTPLGRWLLQMLTCTVICTSVVDWLLMCVSWNMIAMALRRSSGCSSIKTLPGTTTKPQLLSAFLTSSNGTLGIFVASVLIGLVWANTYDATRDPTPLGLATAGTAGVLGNIGSRDISQRYPLYCVNAIWLTLALVVPDHSVFAMAGSIALGSALGFTSLTTSTFPVETPGNLPAQAQSQRKCSMVITLIATACAVGIVAVPVLTLAFPSTFGMIVE